MPGKFLQADLSEVLDASPLSLLVLQSGRLVYANARFLRAFGRPLEEALGTDPAVNILDPQMRRLSQERAHRAEAGEPQAPLVYQARRADGRTVWARVESTPCVFAGKPACLSIVQDVTDEAEASLRLRESEERYRHLFVNSPIPMAISRDGRLVLANPGLARLAGASAPEELAGLSLLAFLGPDAREDTLTRLRIVQGGGEVPKVLRRARSLSGREMEIEVISRPFVHEGQPAVLSLAIDVTDKQAAVAVARETEDRYRALVDALPDGVTVHIGSTLAFANESYARIVGARTVHELVGRDALDFLGPEGVAEAMEAAKELEGTGSMRPREYSLKRLDGGRILVEVSGRRVTFGDRPAVQSVIRDITERKRAERSQAAIYRIADASARASNLFDLLESVHSAVGELMDARNFFIALRDATGENFTFPYYRDEEGPPVVSVPIRGTLSGHVLEERRPLLLSGEEMNELTARGVPVYGSPSVSWIGVPLVLRESSFGVLVVQSYREEVRYTEADRDLLSYVSHHIAEAIDRQRKEDQIEHMAFHDGLTGLPNRLLFEDRLTNALAQAERRHAPLCILFVDLDRFKVINDSLGHPTGDEVLKLVGKRLAEGLRDGDSLARRGGDEFLVLLPDTPPEGAASVAQKLIDAVRAPMHCGGHDLTISASCGIAVYPENGHDTETLLKAADIAMYRAKEGGRDAYRLFNPDMNEAAKRRLTVETKLRRSIATREIGPHYQPILNAATGEIVAAEALLRWSPLATGTMPPKEFIPVAEQSGLIMSLGAFVLREALEHAASWPLCRGRPIRVSINIAARQVQDPACVDVILQALREASFPPGRLQLELSESTQITEDAAAVDRLRALKSVGVSIAIDDFGVGYSSLSRLRHLPFDTLKIDGTFIRDITTDDGSGAVAGAVISLGRNLGLEVIAEGVETEAQKGHLLAKGCVLMQGYLFAAALPPELFSAWVRGRES
ncbi:MAG: EAL domain-containing protein [Vicinamibacteria bacterium]|nr:EAL domain-containing protein [Vicinamibacteria bacterium]